MYVKCKPSGPYLLVMLDCHNVTQEEQFCNHLGLPKVELRLVGTQSPVMMNVQH